MGFAAARREVGVMGALCGVRKAGSRIVAVVDSKRGLGITERQREGERDRARERIEAGGSVVQEACLI